VEDHPKEVKLKFLPLDSSCHLLPFPLTPVLGGKDCYAVVDMHVFIGELMRSGQVIDGQIQNSIGHVGQLLI
jgi:hypothetical protein